MKRDQTAQNCGVQGAFCRVSGPRLSLPEQSGTHIALYLRWCFFKGWAGEIHLQYEPEDVAHVTSGRLSATEFFFRYGDGKFTDEGLTDAANVFTQQYYRNDGLYLPDFAAHIGGLMYVAPESAHDFEKVSSILNERAASGVLVMAKP